MKLSQLLSLLRGSILNDRTDRVSGSSDYLWSDDDLVTFINEAANRFARKSLILRDGSTAEVTNVVLVAGQTEYPLHASVIAVLSARIMTRDADLNRVGHSLLGAYRAPSETWMDPAGFIGLPDGLPLAFSTDEELEPDDDGILNRVALRVYPKPSASVAGQTIRLRVVRKPIVQLTTNDMDASPEIPTDHQIEMLDWAAYLALRIVDDDAGNPKRAADFAANFEAHVLQARKEAMRKLFAPTQWGFGRGGFTWSS